MTFAKEYQVLGHRAKTRISRPALYGVQGGRAVPGSTWQGKEQWSQASVKASESLHQQRVTCLSPSADAQGPVCRRLHRMHEGEICGLQHRKPWWLWVTWHSQWHADIVIAPGRTTSNIWSQTLVDRVVLEVSWVAKRMSWKNTM